MLINSNYAITFGLTENENKIISSHLKKIKCEVLEAVSYIDLITSDYFLAIIDEKKLDDNAQENLIEFYTEVDGNLTERIILAEKEDALSKVSHAKVFHSFDDLEMEFENIFEKAYKKAKKTENMIDNLSYIIMILSEIRKHSGITTAQLAQKINRNTSAVRRYIEVLRTMGENIEYNAETKGWKILNEKINI